MVFTMKLWAGRLVVFLLASGIVYHFPSANGATIVEYDLTDHPGNTPAPPTTLDSTVTASDAAFGSGITTLNGDELLNSSGWTTDATLDLDDYLGFTVSPKSGASMTLETLTFVERRSGSGPLALSVRSSLDSFASDVHVDSLPDDSAYRIQVISLPAGQFSNLTNPIELRIYGYASESEAGSWRFAGSGYLDDNSYPAGILLEGMAVPEPQAISLLFCTFVLLILSKRSK